MHSNTPSTNSLCKLFELVAALRHPVNGCQWDIKQSFNTIAPHIIEEAYEVADTIEQNDMNALKEELGDVLFQIVFNVQLASEKKLFSFEDVVDTVYKKMISRHPHIFSKNTSLLTCFEDIDWEEQKAEERKVRHEDAGALFGVALAFPALMRAQKLQQRAAMVGFDWPNMKHVFDKIQEEIGELQAEVDKKNSSSIEEELGDLLFSCVNLARHLGLDAELALRRGNEKFTNRFNQVEERFSKENKSMKEASLEQLEEVWSSVKKDSSI